ncbi:MAG: ABC transporter permease [Acidobacteriota bacterium]
MIARRDASFRRRLAAGGYKRLLALCPRDSIGPEDEMVLVFTDALRAAVAGKTGVRRLWAGLVFCFGAYLDTVVFALGRRRGGSASIPARRGPTLRPTLILGDFSRQLRWSTRSMRRTPTTSAAAVATLALAVALCAVTFAAVYGTVLKPLPFPGGERLVGVELLAKETGGPVQFEALDLEDLRSQQTSFEALEGYFTKRVTLRHGEDRARSLRAGVMTAGALDHLGMAPRLGRTFRPGEDFKAEIGHTVIGEDLWRRSFGGREDAVGETVEVDGRSLEIVGVMPKGFDFPDDAQLWLPMDFDKPTAADRGSGRAFAVFGRLKSGIERRRADAELDALAARLARRHADLFPPLAARLVDFKTARRPAGVETLMAALGSISLCLLLIAAANLVNLLLARATVRRRETHIRRALGAGRFDALAPFLTEALLYASAGVAVGLTAAAYGLDHLSRLLDALPAWASVELHTPVVVAVAGAAFALALGASLIAAAGAGATDRRPPSVRGHGPTPRISVVGRHLVTVQLALSCALMIGAGLLWRSAHHARHLDRGFDARSVTTASLRLPGHAYPEPAHRAAFFDELRQRVESSPGVEKIALVRSPPGTGPTFAWELEVEGRRDVLRGDGVPVSRGYFGALGIPRLAGRDFTEEESRFGGPTALIVNETAAAQLGGSPVGQRLRFGADEPWLEVVGVVGDSHIGSATGGIGLETSRRGQIFLSWGVAPYRSATVLIRARSPSSGGPGGAEQILDDVLADFAPQVALDHGAPLDQVLRRSMWAFDLFSILFSVYGVSALLLAGLGLYGVTAFAVGLRRQEVGVRLALGATPRGVQRWVLSDVARQLAAGTALGAGLGFALARSLSALLFDVSAADPASYLTSAATLGLTGLAAAWLSTRKIATVRAVDVLIR